MPIIEGFSISSDSPKVLKIALDICLLSMPPVKNWRVEGKNLLLSWTDSKVAHDLPAPIKDSELLVGIIMPWLKNAEYPGVNDIGGVDEDDVEGFTLEYEWTTIIIKPAWVHCGK